MSPPMAWPRIYLFDVLKEFNDGGIEHVVLWSVGDESLHNGPKHPVLARKPQARVIPQPYQSAH